MLTDAHTLLHIAKCRLTTEERKKDERFPVFAVALVLEPLTYDQAKQLGEAVLGHCFTSRRFIQDSLTDVTVELGEDEHCLIVRMAEDVAEHCRLRQVRIPSVTITKRDSSENGSSTKSKKVGPQAPTLRATFHCLIDPADKTHRDFLALNFAKSLFFAFESEQENLFTGVHTDDDQDDEVVEGQAPLPDPDAGDVLEEQRKPKKGRKPRLAAVAAVSGRTPGPAPRGRRAQVAAGSVPHRLLGILKDAGEPLAMVALIDGAKARVGSVRAGLQALIDDRRVIKTGKSRGTRYALAK